MYGGKWKVISLSYLTCAMDSEADAVDAYGLNVYSWCDVAWRKLEAAGFSGVLPRCREVLVWRRS